MLAVFVADIRDQQDLGMVRQEVFLDDMDFQLAEAPAERDLLFLGQMLVAEKDDDIVVEMPLQLGKGQIVDRPGQVEFDLGAARGAGFTDWNRHWDRLWNYPACFWLPTFSDCVRDELFAWPAAP